MYAIAPNQTVLGFGGSNTIATMTASFNSVNTSPLMDQQQKPLSRSLESLAIIGVPCTSSNYITLVGADMLIGNDVLHSDDSRINYSYEYESGVVSFDIMVMGKFELLQEIRKSNLN